MTMPRKKTDMGSCRYWLKLTLKGLYFDETIKEIVTSLMLLYRYLATHTFETLRDAELKAACISSFNDPFECMFVPVGKYDRSSAREAYFERLPEMKKSLQERQSHLNPREINKFFKNSQKEAIQTLVDGFGELKSGTLEDKERILDADLRIICFSASTAELHDELLMWSHYTLGHRGARIGFEIPRGPTYNVTQMHYSKRRVELDITNFQIPSRIEIARKALLESVERKSDGWEYEQEYRLFTRPDSCRSDGVASFFPFNKSWVRRIDFGLRMPQSESKRILELVQADYQEVACYQAEYHETEYALRYSPVFKESRDSVSRAF